jgi:hypothetical protein
LTKAIAIRSSSHASVLVELVERNSRRLDLALDTLFARPATAHPLESIRKTAL